MPMGLRYCRSVTEELLTRMQRQIEEWDERRDRRAVFLSCYERMTRSVETAVGAGRFHDGAWVDKLLEDFADYYFVSVEQWERRDDRLVRPWALAHGAAAEDRRAPMQLLLAGVNAHINYDLVLALVDLLDDEWHDLDAGRRVRRYEDYRQINQIIAETADVVQDDVLERYSPSLDLADRMFGRLDERLAVKVLSNWRMQVWDHAMALLDEQDGELRTERARDVERRCARRSRWLLL
jgi:Family of unknown function (DUF5995)